MRLDRSADESGFLSDGDYFGENENGRATASATGNEADIEDNINIVPPSRPPLMLREKLRQKPILCSPVTPCRLASMREEVLKNITVRPPSTAERLTYRPKSAIEAITDTIERPKGAVPPLSLPSWHCLSLNKKIPRIQSPMGLMYYSPGKVAVQLHRKTKAFILTDPYNRERVVGSPYTALHDPHAKDFINRPKTRQLLLKQGLINRNNEILYTIREFNKYRDYLRTLHCDDVHKSIHVADELWRKEQEQLRSIASCLPLSQAKAKRQRKMNRIRQVSEQEKEYTISRYRWKQQQREARQIAWAKQKEQLHAEKIVRNSEKNRLQKEKLNLLLKDKEKAVLQAYHHTIMKNLHCMERRYNDAIMVKEAHQHQLFEWMEAKIYHSKERIQRYNRLDISCRENLRINAAKRQRKMETYRKNLPLYIARKKEMEVHRWELARKYFYIWYEKVKKSSFSAHMDSAHETCFLRGVSGTLEETVKYLRFQTDTHERLDNFILSIIRLKNDIKRQLQLEEAEEADNEGEADEEEEAKKSKKDKKDKKDKTDKEEQEGEQEEGEQEEEEEDLEANENEE